MSGQASNVVPMFTSRRAVLEAWGKFRRLAIQVHENPALLDDETFMAEIRDAQLEWETKFNRMERT